MSPTLVLDHPGYRSPTPPPNPPRPPYTYSCVAVTSIAPHYVPFLQGAQGYTCQAIVDPRWTLAFAEPRGSSLPLYGCVRVSCVPREHTLARRHCADVYKMNFGALIKHGHHFGAETTQHLDLRKGNNAYEEHMTNTHIELGPSAMGSVAYPLWTPCPSVNQEARPCATPER